MATYPTKVVNGLLFAWLEAGPAAAAAAAAEEPHMPQEAFTPFPWGWNQLPVDYSYWASQAMDPTHANFLHVSCEWPRAQGLDRHGTSSSLEVAQEEGENAGPLQL